MQGTQLIESLSAIEGTAVEKVEAFTNLLVSESYVQFARCAAAAGRSFLAGPHAPMAPPGPMVSASAPHGPLALGWVELLLLFMKACASNWQLKGAPPPGPRVPSCRPGAHPHS